MVLEKIYPPGTRALYYWTLQCQSEAFELTVYLNECELMLRRSVNPSAQKDKHIMNSQPDGQMQTRKYWAPRSDTWNCIKDGSWLHSCLLIFPPPLDDSFHAESSCQHLGTRAACKRDFVISESQHTHSQFSRANIYTASGSVCACCKCL